jgi:flagellar hook-associated protein 2
MAVSSTTSSSGGAGMIDVAGLVSQLMTVESQPLTQLQQKETATKAKLTAYGQVQSAVSGLQTSINALRQNSAFAAAKATATGTAATAVAGSGAVPGQYSVSVTKLARAQAMASGQVATADTNIGSGAFTIRSADGSSVLATVNVGANGQGTLAQARDAINAAGIGVKASIVNDGGQVRMVLASSQTGATNGFQVSTDPGIAGVAFATTQAAQDASFSINGLALASASNTVTDAVPGLTVTLTQQPPAGSPVGTTADAEITVSLDTDAVANSVQAFVTAYNNLHTQIANLTKYDPTTKTAAVLNGESVMRQLQSQVRGIVTSAKTGGAAGEYSYLSEIGISFQSDGSLLLDKTKLGAALTADASKVTRLFTNNAATGAPDTANGFAVQLSTRLTAILGPNGLLDSRQQGLQTSIKQMDAKAAALQSQLDLTQKRLTAQYSALDALVSTRQQQSDALASALSRLP